MTNSVCMRKEERRELTPREKYLKQCSFFESTVRGDIDNARNWIKECKQALRRDDLDLPNILAIKERIATCKRYIAIFKHQLPQQRPENALKRCPFCGGKAQFGFYPHSGNYVICQNCGASTVHRYTVEEVAKKWNKRK